jgi:hypothetical protein
MSLRGGKDYNRAHDLQLGDSVGTPRCAVQPARAKNHPFEPLIALAAWAFPL